jgi:hypothetical protein
MQAGLLLIALGFGYKIYAEASVNARKNMKRLGRAIGVAIMVVSALGTVCTVWYAITCGPYAYGHYGKGGKFYGAWKGGFKPFCPITGRKLDLGESTAADSAKS